MKFLLFLVLCYLSFISSVPLEDDEEDLGIEKHPEWTKLVTEHKETHNVTLFESEHKVFEKDGDIEISDVPFLVSILRKLRNGMMTHECGGSVIRNNVILTAAHCVKGYNPETLFVRAGSSFNHTDGVLTDVASFIPHESYKFGNYKDSDIALIYLSKPLEFSDKIKPIEIADAGEEIALHTLMSVSGFGYNNLTTRTFSDTLQGVVVPVMNHSRCEDLYKQRNIPITSKMICAGYPSGGADSCTYDSGGPLVHNGKQYGIVSFGKKCATSYPGVYTKISALRSWVDEKLNTAKAINNEVKNDLKTDENGTESDSKKD